MKVFVGVSAIIILMSLCFADFSHDFGQGEVVCLVWLANFMIACIAAIMES